jgi:16S rRNA (cytosine967-C5)-methyltransferase
MLSVREINPRLIALDILQSLADRRSNSTLLLQRELLKIPDVKDRSLVTELVLGTLRWQKRLSGAVQTLSRRPLSQLDEKVLLILQLGIYQLAFTRIPAHAAIYETVNLCKRVKLTSAASFVNGVLRATQQRLAGRDARPPQLPDLPEPPNLSLTENLSYRWSHPEWLVIRWLERFGEEETVALMQINNQPALVYIRVNELRATAAAAQAHLEESGLRVQSTPFGANLLTVDEGAPQSAKSFANGEFYIQDAGIERLGGWIDPKPGTRVLEIAAAPGGKTLQISNRMKGEGLIISVDSELSRIRQWQRNMERLGIQNAFAMVADARTLAFSETFDIVVVDAPCSSLGVVRRHPEIKWWRTPEDLPALQSLQVEILSSCCGFVRPEGELVYVVCSFEPEETLEVKRKFLENHPQFELIAEKFLYPHRDQTDGFYFAKFFRKT